MNGKVKNLFDNPPCFRVNQKMAFLIRVFDIAQRGIGSIVCAPLPELMDRKKRDIMERKGDKEDENKRQKQQKESSAAAL